MRPPSWPATLLGKSLLLIGCIFSVCTRPSAWLHNMFFIKLVFLLFFLISFHIFHNLLLIYIFLNWLQNLHYFLVFVLIYTFFLVWLQSFYFLYFQILNWKNVKNLLLYFFLNWFKITTHYILIAIYHIYFDCNSDASISLFFATDASIFDYCQEL